MYGSERVKKKKKICSKTNNWLISKRMPGLNLVPICIMVIQFI